MQCAQCKLQAVQCREVVHAVHTTGRCELCDVMHNARCVQCKVRPALSSPWGALGGAAGAAPALPAKTPIDALRQQKREQKFTFSHLASFVLS